MSIHTPTTEASGDATTSTPPASADYNFNISVERLRITDAARRKFVALLSEADDDVVGVRVFIAGGGCAGMQYGMTYAEVSHATDNVLEGDGFYFYVDPVAMNFLEGAEIDYVDEGIGATFVFNNVFQAVGGSGACGGCGGAF